MYNKTTFRESITLNNYVQEEIKGCERRMGWGGGGIKREAIKWIIVGVCSVLVNSDQHAASC